MNNTTQDLLMQFVGTTPTEANPTPGFTPMIVLRGFSGLSLFSPQTPAEETLINTAKPLFGAYSPEQHRAFRVALYRVYQEQGFTEDELQGYFHDVI